MKSAEKQIEEELHLQYYNYAEVIYKNVRNNYNKKTKRV